MKTMMASKMKIRRVIVGKSQLGLERETGIGQWRISLIERGLIPQPNEAALIASALGVKPEYIFPDTKFDKPASACFADNLGDTESPDSIDL